jgi:hypothetical protein
MRYQQVQDGEWVKPRMRAYFMKCCDCGLVHKMNFKIVRHKDRNHLFFKAHRVKGKR